MYAYCNIKNSLLLYILIIIIDSLLSQLFNHLPCTLPCPPSMHTYSSLPFTLQSWTHSLTRGCFRLTPRINLFAPHKRTLIYITMIFMIHLSKCLQIHWPSCSTLIVLIIPFRLSIHIEFRQPLHRYRWTIILHKSWIDTDVILLIFLSE